MRQTGVLLAWAGALAIIMLIFLAAPTPYGPHGSTEASPARSEEKTERLEVRLQELSRRLDEAERLLDEWEECWQTGTAPRYHRERDQYAGRKSGNQPRRSGPAGQAGEPRSAKSAKPGLRKDREQVREHGAAKGQAPRAGAGTNEVRETKQKERRYVGGLLGLYHQGRKFEDRKLIMTDYEVDFDFGSRSPDAIITENNFSIRWLGFVRIDREDTYTFQTLSDDGVRLWVAGRRIINNWGDHAATRNTGKIHLKEGYHPLRLDFYERGGVAVIRLLWSSHGFPMEIISSANLWHDPDLEERLRNE